MKRGFAFIQYDDERDAEDAIRGLDRTDLEGSTLRVEFPRSKGMVSASGSPETEDMLHGV